MMCIFIFFINLGLWISALIDALLFWGTCFFLEHQQKKLLLTILRKNQSTLFGQQHNFDRVKTLDDFRSAVPLATYDDLRGHMDLIAAGQVNVLTIDQVRYLAPTSGSTSATKLVPYSKNLLRDFQRAINPWIFSLLARHPSLFFGASYWQLSPVSQGRGRTSGGLKIGFGEDSEYFGSFKAKLARQIFVVPELVSRIQDIDTFRYVTLLFLFSRKDLVFVSVWSPSFLYILLNQAQRWMPQLLHDIAQGSISQDFPLEPLLRQKLELLLSANKQRAIELEKLCSLWPDFNYLAVNSRGETFFSAVWPRLKVISCWVSSSAKAQALRLQRFFPRAMLQPKGLIATECFVSFPFFSHQGVLATRSHFFEFISDDGQCLLAHQLKLGQRYKIAVTTSGGLYRYLLGDIVEVRGYIGECPCLEFIGREDFLDLTGEKLSEHFVRQVLTECLAQMDLKPSYWFLAPNKNSGSLNYNLFIQFSVEQLIDRVKINELLARIESQLSCNIHYAYARRLGQLQGLSAFLIKPTICVEDCLLHYYNQQGIRLGNIKLRSLYPELDWSSRLSGEYL